MSDIKIWSCYDCIWVTDKCKNLKSSQYNNFVLDITTCSVFGKCDNTLGCSWQNIGKDSI